MAEIQDLQGWRQAFGQEDCYIRGTIIHEGIKLKRHLRIVTPFMSIMEIGFIGTFIMFLKMFCRTFGTLDYSLFFCYIVLLLFLGIIIFFIAGYLWHNIHDGVARQVIACGIQGQYGLCDITHKEIAENTDPMTWVWVFDKYGEPYEYRNKTKLVRKAILLVGFCRDKGLLIYLKDTNGKMIMEYVVPVYDPHDRYCAEHVKRFENYIKKGKRT